MAPVLRFRSIWGIDPGHGYENWKKWFPTLKAKGNAGVEINIHGLEDLAGLRQICEEVGLAVSVVIFSEWANCEGPKPASGVQTHLKRYREQLELAKILKPLRINTQSGDDRWSIDQSIEFYRDTLPIDAELGLKGVVSHETHRNRALFNPYCTAQILRKVPDLLITADFSHFVVVTERLLDSGEGDKNLINAIIPHVNHIHARIGTTQSSQCPEPTNSLFGEERESFENVWKRIIQSMVSRDSSKPITFVAEYGPFPYHPFGATASFSDLADSEGHRLQSIFEDFAQ